MRKEIKNQNGSAILWAMLTMSLLLTIASGMSVIFISELRQTAQISDSSNAYMAAETGFERARNYAIYGTETVGIVTNQKVNNETLSPTYDFQMKKAAVGAKYDYSNKKSCEPGSDPTIVYCFFAQGKSGMAVRKLTGYVRNTNAVVADYSTLATPFDYGNPTPSATRYSLFSPIPNRNNVYMIKFTGTVDLTNSGTSPAINIGLQDTFPLAASQRGLEMHFNKYGNSPFDYVVFLFQTDNNGRTVNATAGNPLYDAIGSGSITFSSSIQTVNFSLTYRKNGTDSTNYSVTVQLNDATTKACLGIRTYKFPNANDFDPPNFSDYFVPFDLIAGWGSTYSSTRKPFSNVAPTPTGITVYSNVVAGAYAVFTDLALWSYSR